MKPIHACEVTVLLADDHPVCRAGIRKMLDESEFRKKEEVPLGEEAPRAARRLNPQLVVLEIRTLHGNGTELAQSTQARAFLDTGGRRDL